MTNGVRESGGRLRALALVVLFWTTPVQAAPICSIVRVLLSVESSSQELLVTGDDIVADRLINDFDLRLQRVSVYAYGALGQGDDGSGPPAPIIDFVQSRARLVEIYRGRGLTAAQAFMRTPAYLALAQGLRDAMPSREDCDEEALRYRGEYGSERLRPRPDADGERGGNTFISLVGEIASNWFPGIYSQIIAIVAFLVGVLSVFLVREVGQRRDPRYVANMQTTLRLNGVEQPARIIDISRSGARLAIENACARGDQGEIRLCGENHAITVVWANPNFVGVKFQQRLTLSSQDLAKLSG